jgi:hypothetical protein
MGCRIFVSGAKKKIYEGAIGGVFCAKKGGTNGRLSVPGGQ